MDKLLIVGNGFDLHHGMKTNYINYRQFLIENGHKNLVECFEIIDEMCPDLMWNKLEEYIGTLSYENAYCYLLDYSSDEWRDSAHHDFQYEIQKMTQYWPGLKDYLNEWIMTIRYTSKDERLVNIVNSSYILSFNYTNTLEKLYDVPKEKIVYLHGDASTNKELILGHRSDDWYPEWDRNNQDEDIRLLEASEIMDSHFENTRKDIEQIITQNKSFFNMNNFKEIYVIGLSYNDVDKMYLDKIAENNPEAKWFFNWYSSDDYKSIDAYAKSIGAHNYEKINIDK